MIRCPHCNAWDRALEDAKPGVYTCEVCSKEFELDSDKSVDTVPDEVRKEMDEVKAFNAKIFDISK